MGRGLGEGPERVVRRLHVRQELVLRKPCRLWSKKESKICGGGRQAAPITQDNWCMPLNIYCLHTKCGTLNRSLLLGFGAKRLETLWA